MLSASGICPAPCRVMPGWCYASLTAEGHLLTRCWRALWVHWWHSAEFNVYHLKCGWEVKMETGSFHTLFFFLSPRDHRTLWQTGPDEGNPGPTVYPTWSSFGPALMAWPHPCTMIIPLTLWPCLSRVTRESWWGGPLHRIHLVGSPRAAGFRVNNPLICMGQFSPSLVFQTAWRLRQTSLHQLIGSWFPSSFPKHKG